MKAKPQEMEFYTTHVNKNVPLFYTNYTINTIAWVLNLYRNDKEDFYNG
jgi:hypothetical protein